MHSQGAASVEVKPPQVTYGSCWKFQVWDGDRWKQVVDSDSNWTFRLFPNPPTARLIPFDDSCLGETEGSFVFDISDELLELLPQGDRWIRTCETTALEQCSQPLLLEST